MTEKLEALLREKLAEFPSAWADEAIERAREAGDDEAAVTAAVASVQAHTKVLAADVAARSKEIDRQIATNAAIAKCESIPDRGIKH